MSKHMARYVEYLLEEHGQETPDGKAVSCQVLLRHSLQPWIGALRRHPEFDDLYEVLCLMQEGPQAPAKMYSAVFSIEDVSAVIFSPEAGAFVQDATPPGVARGGGLIVG